MHEESKNFNSIEQLAVIEEIIADIYSAYAATIPDFTDFWNEISVEELHHASWVRSLLHLYQAGTIYIEENRFSLDTILTFQTYLRDLLADARKGKTTVIGALSVARDLEGTLAESSFHQVFATDAREVGELLNRLRHSTEMHVERIENKWQEYLKTSAGNG
ncbi:MAG: hypothetical protein WCJ56_04645 [bacterium]